MNSITRSPLVRTIRACVAQVLYTFAQLVLLLGALEAWKEQSTRETLVLLVLWVFMCGMNILRWGDRSDRLYNLWDQRAQNRSGVWKKLGAGIATAMAISLAIYVLGFFAIIATLSQHSAA
ncbi:hypothetical protein ACQPZP_10480 [Spirillospora sp. CA-142024]|uniref:hypothetical protein n=1 Tax=Spirillospora sp. CA-142024 TaxID=3240036 RepID=UPI003D8B8AC9